MATHRRWRRHTIQLFLQSKISIQKMCVFFSQVQQTFELLKINRKNVKRKFLRQSHINLCFTFRFICYVALFQIFLLKSIIILSGSFVTQFVFANTHGKH